MEDMYIWFFVIAVIYTWVGARFFGSNKVSPEAGSAIIERTIDKLVSDGFIKTRIDEQGRIELLKYDE